jgi:hypothetical protein
MISRFSTSISFDQADIMRALGSAPHKKIAASQMQEHRERAGRENDRDVW